MPTLSEIRAKYPQYKDMSDEAFADAFYKKSYSDIPREQFNAMLGIGRTKEEIIREMTAPEDTVIPGLHFADAWQTMKDLGNTGLQGLTLGFGDEISAGVRSGLGGTPYAQNLADEQAKLREGKIRLNANTPGSAETFETLTSLALPGATAKALPKAGAVTRAGLLGGEGAVQGGVSSLGHGGTLEDAAKDAAMGAVLGSTIGAVVPKVSKMFGTPANAYKTEKAFLEAPAPQNTKAGKDLGGRQERYKDVTIAASGGPKGLQDYAKMRNDLAETAKRYKQKEPPGAFSERKAVNELAASKNPAKKNLEVLGSVGGGSGFGKINPITMAGGAVVGSAANRMAQDKVLYDPALLKSVQDMLMGATPDPAKAEQMRALLSRLTMNAARNPTAAQERRGAR